MYHILTAFILKYQSILMAMVGGVVIVCYTVIFREWRLMTKDPARYLQKHGIAPELVVPPQVSKARVAASKKKVAETLSAIRTGALISAEETAKTERRLAEDKARREAENAAINRLLNMSLTVDPEQVQMLLADTKGSDPTYVARVLEEAEKQHHQADKLDK